MAGELKSTLLLSILTFCFAEQAVNITPQQIHVALGETIDKISITWSTRNQTDTSVVLFGVKDLTNSTQGTSKIFVDVTKSNVQYLHYVLLSGLIPGQKYNYVCGTKGALSDTFTFTTLKEGSNWSPRFVLYGDLGFKNAQSVPRLDNDIQKGLYDVALHIGDFAYDMESANGTMGDNFFNIIQPVAANLPYMTCPGNHEGNHNFTQYKNRLFMPGDEQGDRMYYSFNVGPVHVISFSTEFYFFLQYGLVQVPRMYNWLENDLKVANLPENRAKQPWIITMGHRPMYCSNNDTDDCTRYESIVRLGVPILHLYGLEKLFYNYGVDLQLWAHEHSYERLWPVYDRKVYNGSYDHPYINPKAPVHIITGSAGCQENLDPFDKDRPYWSAKRVKDYGYTRMTVFNSTHLYAEQLSDDKGGMIMDKMWLIKDKHGPYTN
ncbi:hypothetical protein SNE40_009905 [Patella caerulea]|uniref:Purple acid phosphatase n=1 Tax=Patella caerulea TaxID=87958 RepID=A0AAN8JQK6_PATCE